MSTKTFQTLKAFYLSAILIISFHIKGNISVNPDLPRDVRMNGRTDTNPTIIPKNSRRTNRTGDSMSRDYLTDSESSNSPIRKRLRSFPKRGNVETATRKKIRHDVRTSGPINSKMIRLFGVMMGPPETNESKKGIIDTKSSNCPGAAPLPNSSHDSNQLGKLEDASPKNTPHDFPTEGGTNTTPNSNILAWAPFGLPQTSVVPHRDTNTESLNGPCVAPLPHKGMEPGTWEKLEGALWKNTPHGLPTGQGTNTDTKTLKLFGVEIELPETSGSTQSFADRCPKEGPNKSQKLNHYDKSRFKDVIRRSKTLVQG